VIIITDNVRYGQEILRTAGKSRQTSRQMKTNNLDKHSNSNSNERNQQKIRYSRLFLT